MPTALFDDRQAAGRALADEIARNQWPGDTVILALPRGGVPVAAEVARKLGAPLDVLVVRKLGAPGAPEFALGAIASGGVGVLDEEAVLMFAGPESLRETARTELKELQRREAAYRNGRPLPSIANASVILVDDGAATGASMRAAVRAARRLGARSVIVALPVASLSACRALRDEADSLVTLHVPAEFEAVGEWYGNFEQVADEDVRRLLAQARADRQRPA